MKLCNYNIGNPSPCPGEGSYVRGYFHGGSVHGGREIFMEGETDVPALLKNNRKLNK
jgi:hypothetical protein